MPPHSYATVPNSSFIIIISFDAMQPMQLNNHKINKRQRFRWAKYTDSKYIIHMWINFGGT
jgi:hypothetical protein